MRYFWLLLLLFFVNSQAYAENSPWGYSIGPTFKINGCGDGVLATLGGRVNASIGYFLFGLGGYGAVAQSDIKFSNTAERVSYSYGGLGVGVRLFPKSFIHITNYNTFGVGLLSLKSRRESGIAYNIDPELNIELDIFSLARLGTGISYRFILTNKVSVPQRELSGLGWQFYVEFGQL